MAKPSPKLCAAASLPIVGGLLWLLAVWLTVPTLPSLAQFTPTTPLRFVAADPAGACTANLPMRYNTSNGNLWGCDALTWTLVAAGTFSGSLAGDVTGTQGATVVGKVGGNAIVLANPFTTAGAFALTLTQTGATNVTLPTSGTLATLGANTFTAAQVATQFNAKSGTNSMAVVDNGGVNPGFLTVSGGLYAFSSSSTNAQTGIDTGLTRLGAASVGVGNAVAGNTTGSFTAQAYLTNGNCLSVASPAVCAAASAGATTIAAAATAKVVNTTAVTANSNIEITRDDSLGTRLGVTCNTQSGLTLGPPRVTARTAATSFTVTIEVGPTTNPLCFNYNITN